MSLIGVFHPNYASIHTQAAAQIGSRKVLVCKGEGGEFERIPERPVQLNGSDNGNVWDEEWKPLMKPGTTLREQHLNLHHYRAVWEGEAEDSYGEAAVIGTLAMVIKALGVEASEQSAHRLATLWWHERQQCDTSREAVVS
ncbi:MAG: hypothetical protein B6D79_12605 [gamma proteobacterium symbiont of Ctena orbiculata]|nr:MAG: hypothetical protein B6D79_12605 [gamma proteobacterium symbiont of Ctena orbiculata]